MKLLALVSELFTSHVNTNLKNVAVIFFKFTASGITYPCARCAIRLGKIADAYAPYYIYVEWRDYISDGQRAISDEARHNAMLAGWSIEDVKKDCYERHGHLRKRAMEKYDSDRAQSGKNQEVRF